MKKININNAFYVFAVAVFIAVTAVFLVCVSLNGRNRGFSITKEQIAAIEDDDELLKNAFDWAENFCPLNEDSRRGAYDSAPEPVRNVLAMLHLDSEVLSGGFPQFFYKGLNESGMNFVEAFSAANLNNVAEIVSGAELCFKTIAHTMPENHMGTEAFSHWCESNPLSVYDALYVECNDQTRAAIVSYIRENIAFFGD